jgi:choline dehydrogenase-like flavoprotein
MKIIFLINNETEVMIWFEVLFYTRAAASDYDDWENVYGNKGWGSEHLRPLLKKVRVFTVYPR